MRDDGAKCKYQTRKTPLIDLSGLICTLVMKAEYNRLTKLTLAQVIISALTPCLQVTESFFQNKSRGVLRAAVSKIIFGLGFLT